MGSRRLIGVIALVILVVTASVVAINVYLSKENGGVGNQPPSCEIDATPMFGTAPLNVTFTISASDPDGSIESWSLDVLDLSGPEFSGEGAPPSTRNYTYYYTGWHNVKLTVTDDDGAVFQHSITIQVATPPISCSLSVDMASGNAPLDVNFTLSVEGPEGMILYWDLRTDREEDPEYYGSGFPPSFIEHTYWDVGTHVANLTILEYNEHEYSAEVTILVIPESTGNTSVYFIDVGQGDSILIQTPDGKNILIDAGDNSAGSTVTSFLSSLSITIVDVFVGTHPHADHIGGADDVLESFDVLSVYCPGYGSTSVTYADFMAAVEAEGCPLYTDEDHDPGDFMNWSSEVSFQILNINADADSANDASIVLKMVCDSVSFLFTGDIGFDVESEMMASFDLDVDILKVSHHGSAYATSDDFLDETAPDLAIISVGEGNSYGHPATVTLTRLQEHDITFVRTDVSGTVMIVTNGTTWMPF